MDATRNAETRPDDDKERRASTKASEEIPACQSCRKRKLKCSREMPSCSQCARLSCPCAYDQKKQKPGLKSGAVESLNRRLEVLERMVLDGGGGEIETSSIAADRNGCVYHAALLIADAVKGAAGGQGLGAGEQNSTWLNCHRELPSKRPRSYLDDKDATNATKKQRTETGVDPSYYTEQEDLSAFLPPPHILDAVFDVFFTKIHPWIPCVHKSSFLPRWESQNETARLSLLVHAMICAVIRHLPLPELGLGEEDMHRQMRLSRNIVTKNAMEDLSVEKLQALIILAFDHIGEGNLSKAWPIIGSLTRTVEYLQLTVEPEEKPLQALQRPVILLEDAKDFAEMEGRRRVFWNVFLLDRLCSVTTGWNTSLTANDVRRRLPSNGDIWARGDRTDTPYFGIWDKSAARIGNSITYIPTQRSPLSPSGTVPGKPPEASPAAGSANVGAFAYRIEATESLSQVTSFFLQQSVNFRNRQEVGSWLTRFKELDLRLVHWKLFLPPKWKDSNVSRDEAVVKMDPNLTLAHVTHNTSMILLHQHIAYPPAALTEIVKLPSSCSAETCQLAAIETASIATKYLMYTDSDIVTGQFSFCAFVAARVLLVHWKFYNTDLAPEFFSLLQSLRDMSARWQGPNLVTDDPRDLAARYASLLQVLHSKLVDNTIELPAESLLRCDITSDIGTYQIAQSPARSDGGVRRDYIYGGSPDNVQRSSSAAINNNGYHPQQVHDGHYNRLNSHGFEKMPAHMSNGVSMSLPSLPNTVTNENAMEQHAEDELTVMSNVLLGSQFSELDRVITLDGTDFTMDMNYWGNFAEY